MQITDFKCRFHLLGGKSYANLKHWSVTNMQTTSGRGQILFHITVFQTVLFYNAVLLFNNCFHQVKACGVVLEVSWSKVECSNALVLLVQLHELFPLKHISAQLKKEKKRNIEHIPWTLKEENLMNTHCWEVAVICFLFFFFFRTVLHFHYS